jgi:hypothetical protein
MAEKHPYLSLSCHTTAEADVVHGRKKYGEGIEIESKTPEVHSDSVVCFTYVFGAIPTKKSLGLPVQLR